MVEPFSFEHSHRFTEREYVALFVLMVTRPPMRLARRLLILALTVVCLLWSYTLLIGILLLLAEAFIIWLPHTFSGTAAHHYRESKLISTRMTYGVSESRLWVRGPELAAEAGWKYLGAWRIRDGWLILPCESIPTVFLPLRALQEAGLHEQVFALARAHGKDFDRPR